MKTKNYIHLLVFIVFTISLLFVDAYPGVAQTTAADNVSFTVLAQKEIVLQGPLDIKSFSFSLPADWKLLDGGLLHLNFNASFNDVPSVVNNTSDTGAHGYIDITLNNTPVATVLLNHHGENSIDLPLSLSSWILPDSRQTTASLQFTLKTAEPCRPINGNNSGALLGISIIVRPNSYFTLPHISVPVVTDLRRLPYPIFQNTFIPDNVVLVMPDQPTEAELQAVFITAATFGRLSNGKLILNSTTVSRLDSAHLVDSNIIFVGKPANFPQLALADWVIPVQGQGFSDKQIDKDDGVLQMAVSPKSTTEVWLMVSGQTDLGVVKSAKALGIASRIQINSNPALAIISNSQSQNFDEQNIPVDRTFADLGYSNETRSGPGIQYVDYFFQIPAGQQASNDAYLDLTFAHSSMFDFEQSGVSVILNDQYIGSFRFSDRTAQVSTWRLNIPGATFKEGTNYLLLEAGLYPITYCTPNEELWFTSRSESILHIPTTTVTGQASTMLLNKYPAPFIPTLDKTAFVVSKDTPDSWSIATSIAYDLGIKTGGAFINPVAAFADSIPDSVRKERSLLIIGYPSVMPLMQEFKLWMPAPFKKGSDIADIPSTDGSSFRVPQDTPVGYLQIFPSPWNIQGNIITVSGNSIDGLKWGADALIIPTQRSQLKGNLAIFYNNQIIVNQVNNVVPIAPGTPSVYSVTQIAQSQSPQPSSTSTMNIVTISTIIVVMLAFLGILFLRINRSSK